MRRLGAGLAGVVVAAVPLVGVSPASSGTSSDPGGSATGCPATAYITHIIGGTVSTIDVATRTTTGPDIPVGDLPDGVAITPCVELSATVGVDGRTVTVTGTQYAPANTLTVTLASTPTTLGTIEVASNGTFTG